MAISLASIELIKCSITSQGFRDQDKVSVELAADPAGATLIHPLHAEKVVAAERRLRLCDLLEWRVGEIQAACPGKVVDATNTLDVRVCGLVLEQQTNVHGIAQLLIDEMVRQECALEAEAAYLRRTATSEYGDRERAGGAEA